MKAFEFGIFLKCLKVAKIIPLFKSGNKNEAKTTGLYLYFQVYLKSLKISFKLV